MTADGETFNGASVLAAFASVSVTGVPAGSVDDLVLCSERLNNAAHALAAIVQDRYESDGTWASEGATSAAQVLSIRTGTARAVHWGHIHDGAALRLLPSLLAPALAGLVPADNLRALADCVRRFPELARRDETLLVDAAVRLDTANCRASTKTWLSDATTVSDQLEPPPETISEWTLSEKVAGTWVPGGAFSTEDAAIINAAVDAIVDPMLRDGRDDPTIAAKPVSVLRGQALVDLCSQSMRREPSDASVPDRYRVAVFVDHDLPAEQAPVACCDSSAYRVVLNANGEILDVGRTTARWPVAIRRAITIRDRGCVFPTCDRPASWSDVHHCDHWGNGGHTSVDNGALLCRRHHTFIHKDGWSITMDGHKPQVRLPDGTPYIITRWLPFTTPTRPDTQLPDRPGCWDGEPTEDLSADDGELAEAAARR